MRFLILFWALFTVCLTTAQAETFYIAANGQDSNSGLSPKTPWQTLTKVNETIFKAGDSILFHRNDLFRGNLLIRQSGLNPKLRLVYGAYGKGAVPIISGSEVITTWKPWLKKSELYSS